MTNKKYELTDQSIELLGVTLRRIRALRDFGNVKKGELGGYVQSEDNLSHAGDAWVYDNAMVFDKARVIENAKVRHNAKVSDEAIISKKAIVEHDAHVYGRAILTDYALVASYAKVGGRAIIKDRAIVLGYAMVYGKAFIGGKSSIGGHYEVFENAEILIDPSALFLRNEAHIRGDARISSITDIVTIAPLGSQGYILTAYRSIKRRGIEVSIWGDLYTLKEFELYISHMRCTDTEIGQYRATIEFLKQFFSVNEGSKNHGRT